MTKYRFNVSVQFCKNGKLIEKSESLPMQMEIAESLDADELRDAVRLYNRCSPSYGIIVFVFVFALEFVFLFEFVFAFVQQVQPFMD